MDLYWAFVITLEKVVSKRRIVGMSGGIDSSLSACVATEALGSENVIGISMPSIFSSDQHSAKIDAPKLA